MLLFWLVGTDGAQAMYSVIGLHKFNVPCGWVAITFVPFTATAASLWSVQPTRRMPGMYMSLFVGLVDPSLLCFVVVVKAAQPQQQPPPISSGSFRSACFVQQNVESSKCVTVYFKRNTSDVDGGSFVALDCFNQLGECPGCK
ncbi:hypothetical protein ACA910_015047 [Epithemia clementina (nom. ined.)]